MPGSVTSAATFPRISSPERWIFRLALPCWESHSERVAWAAVSSVCQGATSSTLQDPFRDEWASMGALPSQFSINTLPPPPP